MKKLTIVLIVLFMAVPCFAAEAKLAWDGLNQEVDGYRLFKRVDGQAYDYTQPFWTGNFVTATARDLEIGTKYFFVVRAYKGASESADSNEVSFTPPLTETPQNLIVTALEEIIQGLKHLKDAVLASAKE
jgi:hypothetical protein